MFLAALLTLAQAQDSDVVTLHKGQPAPFDGSLLTTEAVAKIVSQSELAEKECKIEFEAEKKVAATILDYEKSRSAVVLQACVDGATRDREAAKRDYDELAAAAKRQQLAPVVTFSAGVVGGIVITLASAWAIEMTVGQ